jgi:hypothetical protein
VVKTSSNAPATVPIERLDLLKHESPLLATLRDAERFTSRLRQNALADSSPRLGRTTSNVDDNDMENAFDFLSRNKIRLSSFLNSLGNRSDQATLQKLAVWSKTDGPRAFVENWAGADEWALARVTEMVKKETRAMGRDSALKVQAKRLRDPNSVNFNIVEMYGEMVETMPSTVAVLEAIVAAPPVCSSTTENHPGSRA